MTPEEYSSSLDYQYCRSDNYLNRDIFDSDAFSYRENNDRYELLWEKTTQRKNVMVYISCETVTMKIVGFSCSSESLHYASSSHFRPAYYKHSITSNDKADFKEAFQKYVSHNPQIQKDNKTNTINSLHENATNSISVIEDSSKNEKKRKEAEAILQDWISGIDSFVPDIVIALRRAPELVDNCISYIVTYSKKNQRDWPLYALPVIGTYLKYNGDKDNPDLKIIYNMASEYQRDLNGFNPWQYRFVYNPLEEVLSLLSFINE